MTNSHVIEILVGENLESLEGQVLMVNGMNHVYWLEIAWKLNCRRQEIGIL